MAKRFGPLSLVASACLAALALGAVALLPRGPVSALTNCDTSSAAIDSQEQEMLGLINAERVRFGVVPLKFSAALNQAAAWKSGDSTATGQQPPNGTFGHTDSLGRSPAARFQDCGYAGTGGENIAWGFPSAQATFNAWMGSQGHRDNIQRASFRVIGIGRVGTAWTTDFGTFDDSGIVWTPTSASTATPTRTATATRTETQPAPPTPLPTHTPTPPGGPLVETAVGAGLNLVAYAGPVAAASEVFASLGDNLVAAYRWDAVEGWQRYLPGKPEYVSNLTTLRPGEAYFLLMAGPGTWRYQGF